MSMVWCSQCGRMLRPLPGAFSEQLQQFEGTACSSCARVLCNSCNPPPSQGGALTCTRCGGSLGPIFARDLKAIHQKHMNAILAWCDSFSEQPIGVQIGNRSASTLSSSCEESPGGPLFFDLIADGRLREIEQGADRPGTYGFQFDSHVQGTQENDRFSLGYEVSGVDDDGERLVIHKGSQVVRLVAHPPRPDESPDIAPVPPAGYTIERHAACNGSGCEDCNWHGRVFVKEPARICPTCRGNCFLIVNEIYVGPTCEECKGTGWVEAKLIDRTGQPSSLVPAGTQGQIQEPPVPPTPEPSRSRTSGTYVATAVTTRPWVGLRLAEVALGITFVAAVVASSYLGGRTSDSGASTISELEQFLSAWSYNRALRFYAYPPILLWVGIVTWLFSAGSLRVESSWAILRARGRWIGRIRGSDRDIAVPNLKRQLHERGRAGLFSGTGVYVRLGFALAGAGLVVVTVMLAPTSMSTTAGQTINLQKGLLPTVCLVGSLIGLVGLLLAFPYGPREKVVVEAMGNVRGADEPLVPPSGPPPAARGRAATVHCDRCGTANPADSLRCGRCKTDLLPGERAVVRIGYLAAGILFAVLGGFLAWRFTVSPPDVLVGVCLTSPVAWALAALGALIGGIVFAIRRTPLHERYAIRARRHVELDADQALADFNQALALAPDKARGEILTKRAGLLTKLGRQDEATRDQLSATESPGAYETGGMLVGLLGADKATYMETARQADRKKLLSSGRAQALGYCPRCRDVVALTHKLRCPMHGWVRPAEVRYVTFAEAEGARRELLEKRAAPRPGLSRKAVILIALVLLLSLITLLVYVRTKNGDTAGVRTPTPSLASLQRTTSAPAVAATARPRTVVTGEEAIFSERGVSFAYPAEWETIGAAERQALLGDTLKGLTDYEYIGGVFTGGAATCVDCAHIAVVILGSQGVAGPMTQEQYDRIKEAAQKQMGSRLLDHRLVQVSGVPAAQSVYLGRSGNTHNWDVALFLPGEERMVTFGGSAHVDSYEAYEPVFRRAVESLELTGQPAPAVAVPSVAQTPVPAAPVAVVQAASINVRAGPGTDARVVGGLKRGAEVQVLGRNATGDWLKIERPSGWVFAELVACSVPVASLPVVD